MSASDDRDLRERFAALREADLGSAPAFERLRRNAPPVPRSRIRALAPVGVLIAAAVVSAVVLVKAPGRAARSADEAIAQAQALASWTAPTDAWLTVSGLEIPSSVPSLSLSSVTLPEATTTATASGELR